MWASFVGVWCAVLTAVMATRHPGVAPARTLYVHGVSRQGANHPRGGLVKQTLEQEGFDVELPDVTGPGDSYLECSITRAIEVLEAATANDAEPVRIVASSWGGFVALLWAQRRPEKVRDLCLLGPAFDMKAALDFFKIDRAALDAWKAQGFREMGPGIRVGWDWAREIVELSASECPPQPLCPVTAIMPATDVGRARGFMEGHHHESGTSRWLIAVDGWRPYEEDRGVEKLMPQLVAWARRDGVGAPTVPASSFPALPEDSIDGIAVYRLNVLDDDDSSCTPSASSEPPPKKEAAAAS